MKSPKEEWQPPTDCRYLVLDDNGRKYCAFQNIEARRTLLAGFPLVLPPEDFSSRYPYSVDQYCVECSPQFCPKVKDYQH